MVYTHVMCGNLKPIGFLHSVTLKEPSLPTSSKTVKPSNSLGWRILPDLETLTAGIKVLEWGRVVFES